MNRLCLALLLCGCDIVSPDMPDDEQTLVDGEYAIEWTCIEGCVGLSPMTTFNRLTRDGAELVWWTDGTTNSATDRVNLDDEGCVGGAGMVLGNSATAPYLFCGMSAEVAWSSQWRDSLWVATASRLAPVQLVQRLAE